MTRKEIFSRMPQGSCNLATVYRALHLLEDAGLVKQYDFGDGIARYEFQTDEQASHHHHLICTRCASVAKVEACFPREWQEQIAQENGYEQVTHRLEFFGVCPACARKTD